MRTTFVPEHLARAVRLSDAWVAQFSYGWLGSDYGSEPDAPAQAEMHEREERPAWDLERPEPWGPRSRAYRDQAIDRSAVAFGLERWRFPCGSLSHPPCVPR